MMLVNAESDIAMLGASELLSSCRECKAWPHTNICTPAADSCAISPRFGLATPWRTRYAGSASAESVAPSLSSTTKSNCFFVTPLALSRLTARATRSKPGSVAAGEATFNRACLACHGRDLTEQQRLTPAGWTREVEKMVRWGARVSDEDKPALVDYLSGLYGVR